jgi:hypothetical protein
MRALFFITTQGKRTMSLFSILQLIIALVFIYLILSLVSSQLQEAFAGWQEFRAKRLKESIFQLLGEEKLIYQLLGKAQEKWYWDTDKQKLDKITDNLTGNFFYIDSNQNKISVPDDKIRQENLKAFVWLDGSTPIDRSKTINSEGKIEETLTKCELLKVQDSQLGLFQCQLIPIDKNQIFREANGTYIWVEENTKEIINSAIKITKSTEEDDGSVIIPVQRLEVFTIAIGQSLQNGTLYYINDQSQVFTVSAHHFKENGKPFVWVREDDSKAIPSDNVEAVPGGSSGHLKVDRTIPVKKRDIFTAILPKNSPLTERENFYIADYDGDKLIKISEQYRKIVNNKPVVLLQKNTHKPIPAADSWVFDVTTSTVTATVKRYPAYVRKSGGNDQFVYLSKDNELVPVEDGQLFDRFVWIKDSNGEPVSRSEEKNITIDPQNSKIGKLTGTQQLERRTAFLIQENPPLSLTQKLYENPLFKSLNQSTTGVYGYWIVGLLCVVFGGLSALGKNNLWLTIIMFVLGVVFLGWALYDGKDYSKDKKVFSADKKWRNLRVSQGPSYVEPTSLFAEALIATVQENLGTDDRGQQIQLTEGDTMDDLITKLAKLNCYPPAISMLIEIAKTVKLEGDNPTLPKYKEKLTKLFEASQQRSLGVYTRNATGVAFLVGLLIAIIANADTIHMVNFLARNPQIVTAITESITQKNPDFTKLSPAEQLEEMNKLTEVTAPLPIGWELSSLTSDLQKVAQQLEEQCFTTEITSATQQDLSDKIKPCLISLSDRRQEIDSIIPVPTDSSPKPIINSLDTTKNCLEDKAKKLDQCLTDFYTLLKTEREKLQKIVTIQTLSNPGGQPTLQIQKTIDKQGGWLRVLFGWLITAIALSMGAPFWFDLLGKIMNVRNAAKPLDTPKQPGKANKQ